MATIGTTRGTGSTTVTFAVLALAVWAFVLLQSLTVPVLTTCLLYTSDAADE